MAWSKGTGAVEVDGLEQSGPVDGLRVLTAEKAIELNTALAIAGPHASLEAHKIRCDPEFSGREKTSGVGKDPRFECPIRYDYMHINGSDLGDNGRMKRLGEFSGTFRTLLTIDT
ncbi:hypothetical protein OV090_41850 [Nannocystis sp. RBIL2]|uniref:hypothetical protein n=1 Tax=Nannocystis sp. RBIL2 TaxID=2996788 RepID=UPI0022716F21|nr:hypothetical protein [Nannocystis sp. RBIL2]MCY1071361.1 hypothetical protein [Nannocystis sp. RBIL2]